MHKSNGKKETMERKEDNRLDCSECSGVYHQDEMSATQANSIFQDSGDFYPTAKVNILLYEPFLCSYQLHVGMLNKEKNIAINISQIELLCISLKPM